MKEETNIRGRKVLGFWFDGGPGFPDQMGTLIGKEGKIIMQLANVCYVKFSDGQAWNYPYPEILEHLVEEEKEKTTEELVLELKKLISKI